MTGNAVKRIGLIPAHAGKTSAASRVCIVMGAHPRSRGENDLNGVEVAALAGSSPLTRGKPRWSRCLPSVARLIPAHAGKTDKLHQRDDQARAHPRSRGENLAGNDQTASVEGSSPLTRGKRQGCQYYPATNRLIPAHAGKTKSVIMTGIARAAHPRSRGENGGYAHMGAHALGSSPLTRGKPRRRVNGSGSHGLIPAHAGKTVVVLGRG